MNPAFPDFRACDLTTNCLFNGPCMCSDSRAQSRSTTSFLQQMPAIPGASSSPHFALRWAKAEASSCIPRSSRRRSPTLQLVSGIRGSDQRDPSSPVRSAAHRAGARLSSGIRRLVLHQIGLARARAGDDLRRAWRSRTGRTPGWLGSRWCAGAWIGERDRIRKALLDYCGQDTLALVRLLEKLRSVLVCNRRV